MENKYPCIYFCYQNNQNSKPILCEECDYAKENSENKQMKRVLKEIQAQLDSLHTLFEK